jgi:hypothetical protein
MPGIPKSGNVRCLGQPGRPVLSLSISQVDPDRASRCFSLGAKIKNYDEAVWPENWYF